MGQKQSKRWYRSKRWQRLRQAQLSQHPYCQCPHHKGQKIPAEVVDHKEPHREDPKLFWDPRNLQSMTKVCHDRYKQSQEKGGAGFMQGCDEHGWPLSKEHSWYDS